MRIARALLLLCLVPAARSHAAAVDPGFPAYAGLGPSAICNVSAVWGDTLYLAGHMRWSGPLTGAGVIARTSDVAPVAGSPHVNGQVLAAASDGAGGWYIGGSFTHVGGVAHANLAHILADFSVEAWAPSTNGSVLAIAVSSANVYFSGTFSAVNGLDHSGLAGVSRASSATLPLDPVTGAPTAWDASLTGPLLYGVRAILAVGDRIYLGGDFTQLQGTARNCLAAVDAATGALSPWDPDVRVVSGGIPSASVNSLELVGTDVLAGGTFDFIGSVSRANVARLDPVTGVPSLTAPQTPQETRALAASGANVLIGGRFSTLAENSRGDLVAVRISTGKLLPWAPDATYDTSESIFGNRFFYRSQVTALAVDATRVYVGISFYDPFSGRNLGWVRTFSRTTGAGLWSVPVANIVRALAVVDTLLIAGGDFVPPSPSGGLLSFNASTGANVAWGVPTSGGPVMALLPTPAGLVVGGAFTNAGGQPRSKLAILDPATGLATGWDPGADAGVWSLALAGSTLYCGGDFSSAGGQPRTRIAALDLGTGAAGAWNPGADGSVRALGFDHGIVFAGGGFTAIGGGSRVSIAALSPATGSALAWDAAIQGGHLVSTIAIAGGRVFAGGTQQVTGTEPTEGFSPIMGPDPLLGVPSERVQGVRLTARVEPQPLRAAGLVRFHLPRATDVEVAVYDLAGRRVATVEPLRHREAGEQSVTLERAALRPGLYLVRVTTPEGSVAVRAVIL